MQSRIRILRRSRSSRRRWLAGAICAALAAASPAPVAASAETPRPSATATGTDDPRAEISPSAKIAERLDARFERDATQDFWIRLEADADTSEARDARTWATRGQEVVAALKRTARQTQTSVRELLRAAGARFELYWITNAIHVEQGTQRLARRVAALDSVAEVRAPGRFALPEPVRSRPAGLVADAVEWGVSNINADDVWADYTRGEDIVIASIDSGVQYDHPALVRSYRGNNGDGTFTHDYNWFDSAGSCDGAPCDADTEFSHGTHTMGTMVGDDGAGNRIGVAPGVRWITANGCAVCSEADLLESSQWMLAPTRLDGSDPDPAKRPHIVNNSWGSIDPSTQPFLEDSQQAWADAGIFAVWANGNDGAMGCESSGSPGSRILNYSVGAYDIDNHIGSFSGRGPGQDGEIKPSISAPGVNVRSAAAGGSYRSLSGTSMAAPHVSGAVALLWSAYPELARDLGATRALLDLTAIDTPDDQCGGTAADNNVYGEGRLDALALVELGGQGIGSLSGRITDAGTGEPIQHATVSVTGPAARTASANVDGGYTLALPPGDYVVTVEAFGYETQTGPATVSRDATTDADYGLTALPSATVEGTVSEGSVHGWPLYATLTVAGMPGGTFYTDPITGRYSIELPAGETYDITVDAIYPGISTRTETITVGDADQVADVELPADPYSCDAPGYRPAESRIRYEQTFDDPAKPADWTVVDNVGNDQVWRFDDHRGFGNRTGGEGYYAWVFSAEYGQDAHQDTELVSPSFDLTSTATPAIWFNTDYSDGNSSTADVDLSVDGGQTWTNVWRRTQPSVRRTRVQVPIPQAAGESDVRFRFRYRASFDSWWMVDNAAIGERICDPVDGGLLAGHVRDRNTDRPLIGATVRGDDLPTLTATAATPADANLDDGFYWMFAPLVGSHDLTASMTRYRPHTRSVTIAADAMTPVDFAPAAGQLTLDRDIVDASLELGESTTTEVTVRNDGTAPATLDLGETPRGVELLSADGTTMSRAAQARLDGAPVRRIRGDFSPHAPAGGDRSEAAEAAAATGATTQPWTAIADYPIDVSYNVAGSHDGTIYSVGGYSSSGPLRNGYVYDAVTRSWSQIADMPRARQKPAAGFLGDRLYVAGGWSATGQVRADVDVYDPHSDTWTAGPPLPSGIAAAGAAELDGQLYLIGGCRASCGMRDVTRYDPAARAWESVADYPVPTAWLGCGAIDGRLYCAGGVSDNGGDTATRTYAYDPDTDAWTRKADLPIDLWGTAYTASDGRLLLSTGVTDGSRAITNQGFAYDPGTDSWSVLPNANHATYAGASACGLYKIGGATLSGPTPLVEELPGYAACDTDDPVPWLAADRTSATLRPGEQVTVTVALDTSAVDQPGTYVAGLAVRNDTPYRTDVVTVTADVAPPADWGKLRGTVTGRDCAGATRILPAATVQVDGRTGSYTLRTDPDGRYALWLDAGARRVDLTATKSGWFPATATARIRAGETTVRDLTLTATGCATTHRRTP